MTWSKVFSADFVLGVCLVVLAAALVLQLFMPVSVPRLDGAAAPGVPGSALELASYQPPGEGAYQALSDNPLFDVPADESLTSADAGVPTKPAAPKATVPPDLKLVGVIESKDEFAAIVRLPGRSDTTILRVGDEFKDWTVEQIHLSSISFVLGERNHSVSLYSSPPIRGATLLTSLPKEP